MENNIEKVKRKQETKKSYSKGMLLYHDKRFKEAIPYLENSKEDARTIFILGKCY